MEFGTVFLVVILFILGLSAGIAYSRRVGDNGVVQTH